MSKNMGLDEAQASCQSYLAHMRSITKAEAEASTFVWIRGHNSAQDEWVDKGEWMMLVCSKNIVPKSFV